MGAPLPGPPGYASSEEKTWALANHFGGIIAGFIPSLVVLLAKGNESPTLRAHAVSALNFQITWNAAFIIAQILTLCSGGILFFLPLACWVVIIVFSVLAGLKANEGQVYTYPLSLKLVN